MSLGLLELFKLETAMELLLFISFIENLPIWKITLMYYEKNDKSEISIKNVVQYNVNNIVQLTCNLLTIIY